MTSCRRRRRSPCPAERYFVWVTLPGEIDTEALLARADPFRVTFIPGARLSADGRNRNALRLSFSLMKPPQLAEGARRLGGLIASIDD